MTSFEYVFQDPADPLIVDPFEYGENGERALAVRVIPPVLAGPAAERMLQVRTAVLKDIEAPEEVLARYNPRTESAKQVGYIADANPNTYYLSAVVGASTHINKLAKKDEFGLPIADVSLERRFATVGLAKVSSDESGVRVEALDVHPDFTRRSIGSLMLYKGFGIYGNHAGVQPRSPKSEVQFYGLETPEWECPPLIVQAEVPELNAQLPTMLEDLGMGYDDHKYTGQLRTVQATLFDRLVDRGLLEAPESEKS